MTTILFITLGIACGMIAHYLIGDYCLFFMLHDNLAESLALILTGSGVLSIAYGLTLITSYIIIS